MITDELREYIGLGDGTVQCAIRAIADRIDAAHEKAVTSAHSNGITKYGSMVAREYVKLPVDADGVPIRVGDEVKLEHSGRVTTVTNINYNEYGWQVYCAEGGGFDKGTRCRHVQPDSWESIIQDAVKLGYADYPTTYQEAELVERCKRLAGEA